MKILLLAEPDSANTRSWVDGLRAHSCEVRIASVRVDAASADGTVIPLGPRGLPPRLRLLLATGELRRAIAGFQPDLLLAYRVTSYGYLGARSGFRPLVIAAQSEQIIFQAPALPSWESGIALFVRYAIRHADMLHAWSPNIREGLLRFGAAPRKIFTMHRGIDVGTFHPDLRGDRQLDVSKPVFISTRSLYSEYRLDLLLWAFAALVAKCPGARLKVVGDGPLKAELIRLADALGIGRQVAFHGHLQSAAVASLLAEADVYISLIDTEGLSSSLLEAAICGLLPMVWDMPASRLLLENGVSGLLLDTSEPEVIGAKMAEAVQRLPAMRPRLVANAERLVREYDRERNQRTFLDKYRRLVGLRRGDPPRIHLPEPLGEAPPRGVMTCLELNHGNVRLGALDRFRQAAVLLPEVPFYLVADDNGELDDYIFRLPCNCLQLPSDHLDWAMAHADVYLHLDPQDFDGALPRRAREAGLKLLLAEQGFLREPLPNLAAQPTAKAANLVRHLSGKGSR